MSSNLVSKLTFGIWFAEVALQALQEGTPTAALEILQSIGHHLHVDRMVLASLKEGEITCYCKFGPETPYPNEVMEIDPTVLATLRETLQVQVPTPAVGWDFYLGVRHPETKKLFGVLYLDDTTCDRTFTAEEEAAILISASLLARLLDKRLALLFDSLTGLYNRPTWWETALNIGAQAVRTNERLCIMFIDADKFKLVNDTHGHSVGDAVLRGLGTTLLNSIRSSDAAGRYGGEELVIVAVTDDPVMMGNRIRQAIEENSPGFTDVDITVTVSIGVAVWDPNHESLQQVITAADKAVYAAKKGGRNRVVLAE